MNKTRLGALAPLILALAACGGGSGDGPAVFQPGEVLTFAATLDDGSTQETRYLVHAVTADGAPANLAQVDFIMVQTGVNAKAPLIGEVSTEVSGIGCYRTVTKKQ